MSAGDLRKLTEPEVARLFDPRIYARGKEYFDEGRVQRPIVYHDSLMADVRGTLPEDYHVSVDVRDRNYIASCTCPYAFGYCKHIAAVMYGWVKRPSLFRDLGQSEDKLKRLGKEEIVEIVIDMIRYDPDVLYVINLRLTPAPELAAFAEREVRAIFSEEYVDYLNVRGIVRKLEIFREYAMDLSRAHDLSTSDHGTGAGHRCDHRQLHEARRRRRPDEELFRRGAGHVPRNPFRISGTMENAGR